MNGQIVGHYKITAQIGSGGMGVVYLGGTLGSVDVSRSSSCRPGR